MKKIFQIALGILAAIGGFVDIGDLVFNVEAGATLGYQLLWVVVVGVVGIIVYSEMCGRVAAVSKRPCSRRFVNGSVSESASALSSRRRS
jgi:Mn2+/Fe2+ NRAMP family transporter